MKKGLFLMFLLIIPASFAVLNQYGDLASTNSAYVHVNELKYEPYPAAPGRYVDVWIKLINGGPAKINDARFKLIPKYPFSIDANENQNRSIGELLEGQTALLHYKVRVASDAVEGSNPLYYETFYDGRKDSSNLNIWIQTIDANIGVSSVTTQNIVPGEASSVEIQLENMGDSPLTDVNVKLDLTSAALPFIPVNSTTEKKIYLIEPQRKQSIIFNLMALPGAASNAYKVPIEIKYVDGTGANYTKNSIIGLVIGAKPDLLITISSSEIYSKGDVGNIALKITNKGLTDVKLMSSTLKESENYAIISEDKVYLGNIDSDDYETTEYRIKALKSKDGVLTLKLQLDYLDANNNKYSEIKEVPLRIVSEKDLGTGGNGTFVKILVLLFLMAAAFFLYKRWEKKNFKK